MVFGKERVAWQWGTSEAMRRVSKLWPFERLGKPPFRSDRRTGSGRIGGGVGKP